MTNPIEVKVDLFDWVASQSWVDQPPNLTGTTCKDRWFLWEHDNGTPPQTDDEWDERLMEWLLD